MPPRHLRHDARARPRGGRAVVLEVDDRRDRYGVLADVSRGRLGALGAIRIGDAEHLDQGSRAPRPARCRTRRAPGVPATSARARSAVRRASCRGEGGADRRAMAPAELRGLLESAGKAWLRHGLPAPVRQIGYGEGLRQQARARRAAFDRLLRDDRTPRSRPASPDQIRSGSSLGALLPGRAEACGSAAAGR